MVMLADSLILQLNRNIDFINNKLNQTEMINLLDVRIKFILLKYFLFNVIIIFGVQLSMFAQSKTWIGGIGNWDVSSNWSPAGVPGSSSDVLIYSGQVSIPSGYSAICKSSEVNFGAKLTVSNNAELQINGSSNDGARVYSLNSEIINNGIIRIGNNTSISIRGLALTSGGKFTNNSGALLEINRISGENGIEIRDANTNFINYGVVKIGNIASINYTCIWLHSTAQFQNKPGASVELNNTNNYHGLGIAGIGTVFSNEGIVKVGNLSPIKFYGLAVENASTFNNLSGSLLEIDRVTGYHGIVITGNSIFNNAGQFKIGNSYSISWNCLAMWSGGKLNNQTTGVIEVNRTQNNFNGVDIADANTKITNQGLIKMGNIAPIHLTCLKMSSSSQLENTSTGILELNNTTFSHGIHAIGTNTTFVNQGTVKMGFSKKIYDIGILMESGSKFYNYANALVEIDSIKLRDGIRCTGSTTVFENAGMLKVGKTFPIAVHGISLGSTGCVFNNQFGGIVEVNRCDNGINIVGSANFNNYGLVKIGNLAIIKSNGIRLAGFGPSTYVNHLNSVAEIDNVPNYFAVNPGSGTMFLNYGTLKIGFQSPVVNGIGTSFGLGGNFINYSLIEFKNILNNGIHSNQTLDNYPGATLSVPTGGKLQVANSGILNNATGAVVNNFGTVSNIGVINNMGTFNNQNIYKGTGIFNSSLFSNPAAGTVSPGLSPGCLQFTNDWASDGKLDLEINGSVPCSDYDQLQVAGNALAGGDLYVNFSFAPACGSTFQIINAFSYSGSFNNIVVSPNNIALSYSNGIITVIDVAAPLISCPPNIEYTTAPGNCGPVPSGDINLGTPITSDNCGVYSLVHNAPSSYPLGVKNVKWTVTDFSGNTNTCIQKVTIKAGTCGMPQQVYHTEVTQNSAKIKWNAGVPCATDYQLRIRYEISPGVWSIWTAWSLASGPGLEHLFSALSPNTNYNYQIRSKCGSATNSSFINGWFTTQSSGGSLRNHFSEKSFMTLHVLNTFTSKHSRSNEPSVFITVFPNPARKSANIEISGFEAGSKILSLRNIYGIELKCYHLQAHENFMQLDFDQLNLSSGNYIMSLSDQQRQAVCKFSILD